MGETALLGSEYKIKYSWKKRKVNTGSSIKKYLLNERKRKIPSRETKNYSSDKVFFLKVSKNYEICKKLRN